MASKKLNKKGVFLTFISIVIIAAIIIIFTPSNINLEKDISVTKTRVSNINEYVLDLENVYLERTLQATGRRTIIALIRYMDSQTLFLTDFENDFSQVILDGTIDDPVLGITPIDDFIDPDLMTGNTYNDFLNDIRTTAQTTFNVDTVFNPIAVTDIRINQISPWFVDVEADISFTVSTVEETASWTRTVTIKTQIPIENFDDPYYLVSTGGSYVNKIRQSGTEFDEWNVNEVNNFLTDGNYTHFEDSNAPNFIDRFTNNIAPSSCCGIESLVDQSHSAITPKDVSYVDYLYWSTSPSCPSSTLYTVTGIPSHFKIDFSHLVLYNLVSEGSLECPPP